MTLEVSSEQPVKAIYVSQRKPGMGRDEFVRRWRQHGSLGMSMARWQNVDRYSQCDIRGELTQHGRIIESVYDAIGMLWFRSEGHRLNHAADAAAQTTMEADERDVFAEPVANARLLAIEFTSRSESDSVAAKAVRLIEWNADLAASEALEAWRRHSHQLIGDHPAIASHRFNLITTNARPDSALNCHALDELGFCSGDALTRLAGATNLNILTTAEGPALGTARVFLTNEVILYDRVYASPF